MSTGIHQTWAITQYAVTIVISATTTAKIFPAMISSPQKPAVAPVKFAGRDQTRGLLVPAYFALKVKSLVAGLPVATVTTCVCVPKVSCQAVRV